MVSLGPDSIAQLASPPWDEAFRAVPREHFIPAAAWAGPIGPEPDYWIDHTNDPDQWRRAVYDDTTILTQVDDGATDLTRDSAETSAIPSSSSTAPSLVATFLDLLDPYPGDRVLEIGTGTGWTAGLLSARLGPERVVSVEIDGQIAKQATENLGRAGYQPRLVVGDGTAGYPESGPYDRVHVTCGVRDIPYPWVEQSRPGGVIALPWAPNHVSGYTLTLTVTGEAAVGRLHGDTGFMMLRSQRFTYPPPAEGRRESLPRVDPRRISRAGRGLEVALAGLLPGVLLNGGLDGSDRVGLRHPSSQSYGLAVCAEDGAAEVTQIGERSLWDELEAAYLMWVGWGCPSWDRFGVTVDPAGQHVWLERPSNWIAPLEG